MIHIGDCLVKCFAVGAFASVAFVQVPAARAATETVVYSFCGEQGCPDGEYPFAAGLTDVKGTLYGTTEIGGAYGDGTVFSIDRKTGTETVLYSFGNTASDAAIPLAGMIDVKGTLYGTTNGGGAYNGGGTVFAIDLKTGAERVLHSFGNGSDGKYLQAGLIDVDDTLYGTTWAGGSSGEGTVFSLNLKTGTETVLHAFANIPDGANPSAGLIDVKGTLYGTTSAGGANECFGQGAGCGTVFSIDPKNGRETVLHSFAGGTGDGVGPGAGLIDVKGTLFGTTEGGGSAGGIVFTINPRTGSETVFYSFGRLPDGENPSAGLIEAKGMLYGTANDGGAFGEGAVFSLDPKTGSETVLHSFGNGSDGENPFAGLIDVKGTLYGTTFLGGADNGGTVFAVTP